MNIFLIVVAILLLVVGLLGTLIPILPGVVLSYVGLLVIYFGDLGELTSDFLLFWLVAVLVVQLLDYYVPIWGVEKFGGTKYGKRGATIGVFVGLFFGVWGIFFAPFVGTLLGELLGGLRWREAARSGFGSFIGILAGTLLKAVAAGFMLYYGITTIW